MCFDGNMIWVKLVALLLSDLALLFTHTHTHTHTPTNLYLAVQEPVARWLHVWRIHYICAHTCEEYFMEWNFVCVCTVEVESIVRIPLSWPIRCNLDHFIFSFIISRRLVHLGGHLLFSSLNRPWFVGTLLLLLFSFLVLNDSFVELIWKTSWLLRHFVTLNCTVCLFTN